MLYTGTMLRSVLALAVVAGSGAAASAGTYLGLGLGTAADMSTSSSDGMVQSAGNGRSGRLLLGWRFGRLSLEGDVGRFGALLSSKRVPYDATQAAAILKYSLPLGNNFEVFGKGGLQRTWLSPNASGTYQSASGNGYQLGAGFEYRLNAVLAGGSVFVDYSRSSATLSSDSMIQLDSTFSMWTAGFTVAI